MAKLNLNDIEGKETKGRFNSLEALNNEIDDSKMPIFTHKAGKVVIVAAKDSGKSFPVDLYKIAMMEKDPMASSLTLMKHITGASKRGRASFWKALTSINGNYSWDKNYEYNPSTGYMYRVAVKKGGRRNQLVNQAVEYGSFENSDGLAGYVVSNGGYPFLIHVEEPVLQGDSVTPTKKAWDADLKTILDTAKRHHRTYRQTNPYHAPIPFKTIITMNDWDPDHPVSKETEKYFPQKSFLNWTLDFNYYDLLKLWVDKIDGENIVPELKEVVDAKWEEIKKGVLERHTKYIYVERDNGVKLDTLYVRMQKFANPSVANDEEAREEVYDQMYEALVKGNTLELAKAFGMGYGGTLDEDKRFVFKNFQPVDTIKKLAEPGRAVLGFSMAWDHDANRGPVGTPVTLSAIKRVAGNPFDPELTYHDMKVMVHPQVIIEGYGKGKMGVNTGMYHEMMVAASEDALHKYTKRKNLTYGSYAVFDDDDGSYVSKIANGLVDFGYSWADSLENKNGKIETGGFGTVSRDDFWGTHVDLNNILIDKENIMLTEWLKQVPKLETPSGETKRSVKGKWGKRYKDISNSAEYAWWPFRFHLSEMDRI